MTPPATLVVDGTYSGLPASDSDWLRDRTAALQDLLRRTAGSLVRIGAILAEVRERLREDAAFHAWLRLHWPQSRSTAYRRIAAAEQLRSVFQNETSAVLDQFHSDAATLLVDADPPARALALDLAGQGHEITGTVMRRIIRQSRPESPASERSTRPSRSTPHDLAASLRLLIPGGERSARFDLTLQLDPDDDLIVGIDGEHGRDPWVVLTTLASRSAPDSSHSSVDSELHRDWAERIGVSIARDYSFHPASQEAADVRSEAVAELCAKSRKFDPARVPPEGDPIGAFRGWVHPSIQSACRREAERLRNGGTFHTTRNPSAAPRVQQYTEDETRGE